MNFYAIGDVQGCADSLDALLAKIEPAAKLVFVGDLVNRGPHSLRSLRQVRAMGARATALLGNHDLHLLAAAAGIRKLHKADTLNEILEAPDRDELLDWVRHRPLAHFEAGALMVHAGVLPEWSAQKALALAGEVEAQLRSDNYQDFLASMYGDEPDRWSDDLAGPDRWRCIVNVLTRMRMLSADGRIDFKLKEDAAAAPAGYSPWYQAPHRAAADVTVIFGHWSAQGLVLRDDVIGLDTGCVWGGQLTALRWPERSVVQVQCPALPALADL